MQDRMWEEVKRRHDEGHEAEFVSEHPAPHHEPPEAHVEVRHENAPEKSHERLRYDLDRL